MKVFRSILILLALVICMASRAESVSNRLIRSLGNFQLDNPGSRLEISKATDNRTLVKVTWESKNEKTSVAPDNNLRDDWFAFVENTSRIWVFDGKDLWVIWQKEKSAGISSSREEFKSCPNKVRETLPKQAQDKYFNKQ